MTGPWQLIKASRESQLRLILASASPRRRDLLEQAGFSFTLADPFKTDENYPNDMEAKDVATYLAGKKADAYPKGLQAGQILITADTTVLAGGMILNKPADRAEAIAMLSRLSGRRHSVVTGICLKNNVHHRVFSEETRVYFNQLSQADIAHYVDQYKPYDKAGAYGIQEWIGLVGIDKIEGCYFNVVGLPVRRLCTELASFVRANK